MKFLEATIWLTQQRHAGHGLRVSFTVMADCKYGRGRANVVTHDCSCGLAHNRVSRDSPKH